MHIAWINHNAESREKELPKPRTLEEVHALLNEMKQKWSRSDRLRNNGLELIVPCEVESDESYLLEEGKNP